ncbi:MAG TPA: hypothetical protein VI488_03665 [Candidatus Angelobacter sp.]
MKRLMILSLVLMVCLVGVVWVTGEFLRPVHGQGTLSNADIVGSYAFSLVGSGGEPIQFFVPGTLNQGNPVTLCTPGSLGCITTDPPESANTSGTGYILNFVSPGPTLTLPIVEPMSIAGQFVSDGAGNITSGSGFVFSQSLHTTDGANYTVFDRSCNFTLTGTYSITGGTSTMTINPVGTCITPGLSATFNLLPGNAERKDGVEFGVMYLSAPIANHGGFSSFFNGSFFKQ